MTMIFLKDIDLLLIHFYSKVDKNLGFYPSFNLLSPKVIDTDDDKFDELILKKQYFNFQWAEKRSLRLSSFQLSSEGAQRDRSIAYTIDCILKSKNFELCFCPGGIYSNSFFWRGLCDINGIRFSSFDGDQEGLMVTLRHWCPSYRRNYRVNNHDTNTTIENEKFNIVKLDIYQRSLLKAGKIEDLCLDAVILFTTLKRLQNSTISIKQNHEDNILEEVLIF